MDSNSLLFVFTVSILGFFNLFSRSLRFSLSGLIVGFLSPLVYASGEPDAAPGQGQDDWGRRAVHSFSYYFPMAATRIGLMMTGEGTEEEEQWN
jgi:hypothetical protein